MESAYPWYLIRDPSLECLSNEHVALMAVSFVVIDNFLTLESVALLPNINISVSYFLVSG
jgi:hypothetical protein